jgi:four helix bundle protein
MDDVCGERTGARMAGKDYRDLAVWREAMGFVAECYRMTDASPKSELYGLTSQLQSAAVSIPANIAEGQGRPHEREFLRHLAIAYGSLAEAETHIHIDRRLAYVDGEKETQMLETAARIGCMLNGLKGPIEGRIADQ